MCRNRGTPPCGSVGPVLEVRGARRDHRDDEGNTDVGNMVWKILGTGSAVVAGLVANKVIGTVWSKAGKGESIDPNNPDNPIGEAIAYAVLAGVAMGVARTVATRQAAAFYKKSAGHLPDAMQDAKDEIDKVS